MSNKQKQLEKALSVQSIEYMIYHITCLWRRLINYRIKHLGVSGTEKRILFHVARNPGMSQVHIANYLELEPQNLMRSLDKLEKMGWIKRCSDVKDRRVKCIYITENAEAIITKISDITSHIKQEILSGITDKKIQEVTESLSLIRQNLTEALSNEEH